MRARPTRLAAHAALAAGILSFGAAAAHARPPLHAQLQALRAHAHRALLDLYALDTQLHTAQSRLVALNAEAARLRSEDAALVQEVAAMRRTLRVSRVRLVANLRVLYKQDEVSPLAVVLGARSLDDAVTRLDSLTSLATQTRTMIVATSAGERRLHRLRRLLRVRRAHVAADVAAATRTTATLAAARTGRLDLLARLRTQEQLKAQQIGALQQVARQVERKSNAIEAAVASPPVAVASPGGTLTVTTTGYSLGGRTSTGMPVGYGVVAVDPAVIPLGTRLTIPGYGEAVAADTGGAVRGATVDLWFPTLAQARAWGRRTVTITLH